jgi:hypothetical protein
MIEPVVSIRIEPEGKYHVRIQFNYDEGQFFYLRDDNDAGLLRERIARMCLGVLFDQYRTRFGEDPYPSTRSETRSSTPTLCPVAMGNP